MPEANRLNPPFRAEHVGSMLRPDRLKQAREKAGFRSLPFDAPAPPDLEALAALDEVEDECIRELVAMEEEVGLRVVTDGEFRRQSWQTDIMQRIHGLVMIDGPEEATFQGPGGLRSRIPCIDGKLSRDPDGLVVKEFEFTKTVTDRTVKVTMVSPSNLYAAQRGGSRVINEVVYPDRDEALADLVRIYRDEIDDLVATGCRYVQFDNTASAGLCDPKFRALARRLGVDPDEQLRIQARIVSDTTRGRPDGLTIGMHLCRGNAAGQWMSQGGYEPVAEVLFNAFDVDAFFLEYDTERAGDFTPLRFVPKGKSVVLGLVTTKAPENDDKETLKRRIDEAARHVDIGQLCLSPQCGFASGVRGNPISFDDERRKLALVVEVASEVWGGA